MIMAKNNNPYYTEEQRQALLEGRKAQEQKPRQIRSFNVKLDKEAMGQLKDINDNTLETAVGMLDVKEGIKSFEDRFKEKFANFNEQIQQESSPLAEHSADFVGPVRPINMSDNSSRSIDNSVSVEHENPMADFYREHHDGIQAVLSAALSIIAKRPVDVPLPEAPPEEEHVVDRKEKKTKERNKERNDRNWGRLLSAIKDNTSGLLSRFIGYSLEALAKFAKWTLILGSLVFAFDVLRTVIQKWFNDILAEGQASKELFGSYFGNVKSIMESIDRGLNNFDMDNLGESLKNLFVKPFALLGQTIKTAITEGMGNLIYNLGEYTKSDTIKDAGTSMRVSAIRDKQKFGMELTPDDMKLVRHQDLIDQRKKEEEANANSARVAAGQALSGNYPTGYKPMYEAGGFNQAQKEGQAKIDAANRAAEEEKRKREELEKSIKQMDEDPKYLRAEVEKENAANRERLRKEAAEAAPEQPAVVKTSATEMDVANEIIDSDKVTDKDRKTIESILSSLEEKNSSHKLSEDEQTRFGDLLQRWQDKISANNGTPSASIDVPKQQQDGGNPTTSPSTVQVNSKTVNNTVNRSIQRTEHKPLVSVA